MRRSLAAAVLALLAAAPGSARAQDAAPPTAPANQAPAAPADQEPAAEAAAPRADGPLATVRLRSGRELTGRIVSRDERELVLLSEEGVRSAIPAASVAEVREAAAGAARAPWHADPSGTRYLYSPSGFMLPRGEGYVSQTELFLTSVAYGATDWLTIGAGGVVPAWFVDEGFNLTGFVKVGGEVAPSVHVAGTVQALWLPGLDDSTSGGLAFGTVTLGRPELHLGVSVGVPFVFGGEENEVGDLALSVSGVARIAPRAALVAESWFFPSADESVFLTGAAVRFIGSRLAVDAGLVFMTDADIPLPWLDFTWGF